MNPRRECRSVSVLRYLSKGNVQGFVLVARVHRRRTLLSHPVGQYGRWTKILQHVDLRAEKSDHHTVENMPSSKITIPTP